MAEVHSPTDPPFDQRSLEGKFSWLDDGGVGVSLPQLSRAGPDRSPEEYVSVKMLEKILLESPGMRVLPRAVAALPEAAQDALSAEGVAASGQHRVLGRLQAHRALQVRLLLLDQRGQELHNPGRALLLNCVRGLTLSLAGVMVVNWSLLNDSSIRIQYEPSLTSSCVTAEIKRSLVFFVLVEAVPLEDSSLLSGLPMQ